MTTKNTAKKESQTRSPKRSAPAKTSKGQAKDAIAMLREDHKRVSELFDRFDAARGPASKATLAEQICSELEIHAQLEEEIFYPAVREAIGDDALMDEAEVEHQSAKDLIAQIKDMSAEDDLFDAKVTVLGEYIKHHVKEEHDEMFPKAQKAELDVVELGDQMRVRKDEIENGIGGALRRWVS